MKFAADGRLSPHWKREAGSESRPSGEPSGIAGIPVAGVEVGFGGFGLGGAGVSGMDERR
jgi:hypothetical protein